MAYWQVGEKNKAREWYGKATNWMEKTKAKDPSLLRFREEARKLLGLPENVKSNED